MDVDEEEEEEEIVDGSEGEEEGEEESEEESEEEEEVTSIKYRRVFKDFVNRKGERASSIVAADYHKGIVAKLKIKIAFF